MKIRIAKYRSHLYFNHRCKENKVLPFSLRFKPPIRSKKGYKLMGNTGFSFLRLRIKDCHQSIQRLRSDCQRLLCELSDLIDCSEVLWIEEFCREGELVLPDQKGVTKVVISILITISLARGHSIFLQLLCFNPRHSKIFPTKLYGYTRRHRDWRCVTPPHTHSW
jgi:hypothetical protein